tara:strand:- start:1000 stop:2589 length:1590 start_codon:yes stop_codon:yes gene_type:complete
MYIYLILIFIIIYNIFLSYKYNENFKNVDKIKKDIIKKERRINEIEIEKEDMIKKHKEAGEKEEIETTYLKNNNLINIKKTNKYELVYNNRDFYVWEPKPIDNYFPVGQVITEENKSPRELASLVRYEHGNSPDDFTLINMLNNNYGIWKPLSRNKDISFLSYIINKNKPSLNRIQGINNTYLEKTNTQELIKEVNSYIKDSTKISNKFWKIPNSPYFSIDSDESCYYLPEYNTTPKKKIKLKNTKKYVKIWSNSINNKVICVWRPQPPDKDYRILGDIVLPDMDDPNDILETPTVHKNNGKSVLYYKQPLCYVSKEADICFWRPKQREGYTTLGSIMTLDKKEPSNDILYSIPIEYIEINPESLNIWNNQNINIWSNDTMLFAVKNFRRPSNIYRLNPKFIQYEKDSTDTKVKVQLTYIPKNINNSNLQDSITNTLSNKLDIDKYRLDIENIDKINNKIDMVIKEKKGGSIEEYTKDIIDEMVDIIYKRKIIVKNKKQIVLIITNINVEKNKETISIDNSQFIKQVSN